MARRVIVVDDTDPRYWDPRYTADRLFSEFDLDDDAEEDDDAEDDDAEEDDEDRFDGGWRGFPAAKPRLHADGIRAVSQRGAIATTWWSKRFLAALESFDAGGRLTRGRSYARSGQVLSLTVTPGMVLSRVQGSRPRPYDVALSLPVFRDAEWDRILSALAAQAVHSAALLTGQMPESIEDALAELGMSLFPTPQQLNINCSCPDWGNPCKHAAAACYILAEQFDADPFAIFAWRGMGREQALAGIRSHRERAPRGDLGPGAHDAPGGEGELSAFWACGDILEPTPAGGEVAADRVIRRLGPTGIVVRGSDLADLLLPAYEAMVRHRWER